MKHLIIRRILITVAMLLSAHLTTAQTIPPSLAAPAGSVDTAARGFKVKTVRITGLQINTVDIAEGIINGTRLNPATGEPYENLADPGPNPDGSFFVDTVVNWDQNALASGAGNLPNDDFFPGIPGPENDFLVEVTGFLDLPAGTHRIGVNSDDGFKFTIGTGKNPYDPFAMRFPGIDTTRGQANTEYNITVQTAGLYPFRLLYWERGGDARLEFYNFTPGSQSTANPRVLVNDSAQANAFKSYRSLVTPFDETYVRFVDPGANSVNRPPAPFVRADIQEQTVTVNTNVTPRLFINVTNELTVSVTRNGTVVTVAGLSPMLPPNTTNSARLSYTDSAGKAITNDWTFVVSNYPTIPASMSVASADTSKPGFKAKVYQIDVNRHPATGLVPNAERQIAAGYIDPVTNQPYPNTADLTAAGPDGYFIDPDVINWNQDQPAAGGSFPDDEPVPGITGNAGPNTTDRYVFSVEAFLELKAGPYRFGVNSDDGFRLSAGWGPGDVTGIQFGTAGDRGFADTFMDFVAAADGIYPFRLMWFETGGGSGAEFFVVNLVTGQKTLINDLTASTPIKAYRESAVSRPYVSKVLPTINNTYVTADEDLVIEITDGALPLNPGSITRTLNNVAVTDTPTKAGNVTTIRRPGSATNLLPSGVNTVRLSYTFTDGGNTVTATNVWSYTVPPYTRPIPPANRVLASQVTGNGFKVRPHQFDRSGDANLGNGQRFVGQGGSVNNMPRPEIQISNGYINRTNNLPYPNLADLTGANPDGTIDVPGTLNHNSNPSGGNTGIFQGSTDQEVPGLPGGGSSVTGGITGIENYAAEITTYLDLKAGAYLFGMNVDDGYVVSSSPNPRDTLGTVLGFRNAPGGNSGSPLNLANAAFNVVVLEDGIYPFRILFWHGGGGVNIEFLTIDKKTGAQILVNDPSGTAPSTLALPGNVISPITAFNTYSGPVRPWTKFSVYPLPTSATLWQNHHQQSGPGPIQVKLGAGNPVDIANDAPGIRPFGDAVGAILADVGTGAVGMVVDNLSVTPTVTDVPNSTDKLVLYTPNPPFASGSTHTAGLVYADTTNFWTFTVIAYTNVAAGIAVPSSRADPTAGGFKAKVVQAAAAQANTAARAEAQLAGTPASVSIAGPEPDASFIITNIINWNVAKNPGNTVGEIGNFQPLMTGTPDDPVPGIPGTGLAGAARFENIAAEIFAYLDLPAGYQKFGVGGDDGWKVQVGTPGQTSGTILFTTDRGAGARDIPFAFTTPEAGLYPVRLVWYQGGGGGNLEFFSYGPNNQKIAINDRTNPNAIKAYYKVTDLSGPTINITRLADGSVRINYTGKLQQSATLGPPNWQDVPGATNPHDVTVSGTEHYYRSVAP